MADTFPGQIAGPDPARPFNTHVARGGAHAAYRKVHLYDSFGYRESDRLAAGVPGRPRDPRDLLQQLDRRDAAADDGDAQ